MKTAQACTLITLPAVLLCLLALIASAPDTSSGQGCIAGGCHAGMLKSATVHAVAESCDNCHQPTEPPHPQKGKKTFKLSQAEGDLCATCHPDLATKKHLHSPVKDGQCTSCHNPHESAEPKLLTQPAKDLCLTCHPDKTGMNVMHGPTAAGDCTACHKPHSSDHAALTVADGAALCYTCHGDIQGEVSKRKVQHAALATGCTSCHNPHGSANKKLLPASGDALCFQCHPEIKDKIAAGKSVHAPIRAQKACASCHAPHASDGDKLLSKSGAEACLDCHKNVIDRKKMTVLHGPIKDGKCTPCHDAHASAHTKLLVKSFPADFYVDYTDRQYELCFSCHNRDLLRFPDTSFATGFRDGNRNLHYLHVNRKEKNRSCKSCHAPHGSGLPKLIAEKVRFNKWDLPIGFVKTETGGSCTPGCHKQAAYDRQSPGKTPAQTTAPQKKNENAPAKR